MEPGLLMGLGRGLESLGQMRMQDRLARQERERLDQIRREEREREDRATKNLLAQFAFQQGLEPFEAAEARGNAAAQPLDMAGTALESLAGMPGLGIMSGAAPQLRQQAEQARRNATRGRRLTITDPSTGQPTEYIQPYERSEEGKREAERSRRLQRLRAGGFDDATADLLADAGSDDIANALLDRLKPPTISRSQVFDLGTNAVVDILQDGTRRKVRDMTPAEIERESAAPGQQPYNWGTVRDDATGQVFQVDPRSGQTRPISSPSGGPIREIPESIRKETAAIDILVEELDNLDKLIDANGTPVLPGPQRQALQTALNNAQMAYKTAAGLGVLNGPDLAIMEQALGDPTSLMSRLQGRGTAAQVKTALRGVRAGQLRRRSINERAFGVPALPPASTDIYDGLR